MNQAPDALKVSRIGGGGRSGIDEVQGCVDDSVALRVDRMTKCGVLRRREDDVDLNLLGLPDCGVRSSVGERDLVDLGVARAAVCDRNRDRFLGLLGRLVRPGDFDVGAEMKEELSG